MIKVICAAVESWFWVVVFFWIMGKYGPQYPNWLPWTAWLVSFEADLIKYKFDEIRNNRRRLTVDQ